MTPLKDCLAALKEALLTLLGVLLLALFSAAVVWFVLLIFLGIDAANAITLFLLVLAPIAWYGTWALDH